MERCEYQYTRPKKKRCFQAKESPFPVPIASVDGNAPHNSKWCYFTGKLVGDHVAVVHSGDMDFLFKMGFFGQGSFSNRYQTRQDYARKLKQRKDRELKIISRRKYLRRLEWQSKRGGVAQTLPTHTLPLRVSKDTEQHNVPNSTDKIFHCTNSFNNKDDGEVLFKCNVTLEGTLQTDTLCSNDSKNSHAEYKTVTKLAGQDPKSGTTTESDPWASTTYQESVDFWRTGESTHNERTTTQNKSNPIGEDKSGAITESDPCASTTYQESVDFWGPGESTPDECTTTQSKSNHDHYVENLYKQEAVQYIKSNSEGKSDNDKKEEGDNTTSIEHCDTVTSRLNTNNTYKPDSVSKNTVQDSTHTSNENYKSHSTEIPIDPRCLSDEEDGTLFVVNDTDESDHNASGNSDTEEKIDYTQRLLWQPAVKRNPFPIQDVLRLTFEEAFFLSYGLGCLVVLDENKKPMQLKEMWRAFCSRRDCFLQNYIVYHNFRSKGWVPKTGIKFGGDFVVYKEGPTFYHASYVVLTRLLDEESCQSLNDGQHATPTWASLAGQNRITEQASKELMLCYVMKPSGISLENIKASPKYIPSFKIQEVVVKRWLMKHERDNLRYMEIP